MRIGVVAYALRRRLPAPCAGRHPVLVNGIKAPIVGRVSMDMLEVDLTDAPQAQIGSEVTLWGHGPQINGQTTLLSIDEVAQHCGTIGYELMCALSPRVAVEVVDSAA